MTGRLGGLGGRRRWVVTGLEVLLTKDIIIKVKEINERKPRG